MAHQLRNVQEWSHGFNMFQKLLHCVPVPLEPISWKYAVPVCGKLPDVIVVYRRG